MNIRNDDGSARFNWGDMQKVHGVSAQGNNISLRVGDTIISSDVDHQNTPATIVSVEPSPDGNVIPTLTVMVYDANGEVVRGVTGVRLNTIAQIRNTRQYYFWLGTVNEVDDIAEWETV